MNERFHEVSLKRWLEMFSSIYARVYSRFKNTFKDITFAQQNHIREHQAIKKLASSWKINECVKKERKRWNADNEKRGRRKVFCFHFGNCIKSALKRRWIVFSWSHEVQMHALLGADALARSILLFSLFGSDTGGSVTTSFGFDHKAQDYRKKKNYYQWSMLYKTRKFIWKL